MGIICLCPNGHRTNLKDRFAGLRVRCPQCGEKFRAPLQEHTTRKQKSPISPSLPTGHQLEFDSPFTIDGATSQHVRTQPNVRENQSEDAIPAVLDEAPTQLWRIAPPGGEPSSAMEGSELLALLSSSKISAHVYVWRTDWVDWKPVAIVFPDFFRNQ
tara:strand:- start:190 stop:663 length:474 start_codon:yes stop_codon:yes gene_type:complete